jgi:adenylate cyclase
LAFSGVVWLSLTTVFIVRRALLPVAAPLLVGVTIGADVLLFQTEGWFVSPALPLVSVLVYSLFLIVLGSLSLRLRRSLRLHRQGSFQQRMLELLATLVETRDPTCIGHIARMQNYVRVLAGRLARSGRHAAILTSRYRELLVLLCPLHDIGKAAVPDAVLLKRERLTEKETTEMQRHVELGEALLLAVGWRAEDREFVDLALDIIGSHHERWDGGGYPRGLRGEAIPLAGRIVAVAEVYDALISRRCYKNAYTREQSRAILMKGRGTAFDPDLADAFLEVEEEMWKISLTYGDTTDALEVIYP